MRRRPRNGIVAGYAGQAIIRRLNGLRAGSVGRGALTPFQRRQAVVVAAEHRH